MSVEVPYLLLFLVFYTAAKQCSVPEGATNGFPVYAKHFKTRITILMNYSYNGTIEQFYMNTGTEEQGKSIYRNEAGTTGYIYDSTCNHQLYFSDNKCNVKNITIKDYSPFNFNGHEGHGGYLGFIDVLKYFQNNSYVNNGTVIVDEVPRTKYVGCYTKFGRDLTLIAYIIPATCNYRHGYYPGYN